MGNIEILELEKKLLYQFKDKKILEQALRHSSFVNEQIDSDLQDNECLEFLGDAVLSLVVGHILMKRYPDLNEGDLSRMRANLVNESQLACIARSVDLGSFVRLGKGEVQTNGRKKNSILADTFEAVIAAVYLDSGFDATFKLIEKHFSEFFDSIAASAANHDYKSQLQELVQVTLKVMPLYRVAHEKGPDHDKTFKVELKIDELVAEGIGKSKKIAEQDAARKALEILRKNIKIDG